MNSMITLIIFFLISDNNFNHLKVSFNNDGVRIRFLKRFLNNFHLNLLSIMHQEKHRKLIHSRLNLVVGGKEFDNDYCWHLHLPPAVTEALKQEKALNLKIVTWFLAQVTIFLSIEQSPYSRFHFSLYVYISDNFSFVNYSGRANSE